ncbi:MAG TPA: hypothetical protein VE907_21895 [Gammaproteobacteria bacterium]|nr:hypothetical protein [Gammaproteobacteria bacterium]
MQTARGTSKALARFPAAAHREPVALGIATHLGWAAVVAVTPTAELLRVVANVRIETAKPSDIVAAAPYHRAAGYEGAKRIPSPRNPKAVLERAIERQRRHTLAQLRALLEELAAGGHDVTSAAILAGRGRLGDSLDPVARVALADPRRGGARRARVVRANAGGARRSYCADRSADRDRAGGSRSGP